MATHNRINAFRYALNGIKYLFANELHAKIHLCAAICVVLAGLIFRVSKIEWCLLILCIVVVFMAEGFNTALEKLSDRVTQDQDSYIKITKDVAAGAVLLFVFGAVIIGLIIFMPKILSYF